MDEIEIDAVDDREAEDGGMVVIEVEAIAWDGIDVEKRKGEECYDSYTYRTSLDATMPIAYRRTFTCPPRTSVTRYGQPTPVHNRSATSYVAIPSSTS